MPQITEFSVNTPQPQNGVQIPLSVKQRLMAAQLLAQEAGSTAPIYHPLAGVARLAGGALAGYVQNRELDNLEAQRQALSSALKIPTGSGPSPAGEPSSPNGGAGPQAGGAPYNGGGAMNTDTGKLVFNELQKRGVAPDVAAGAVGSLMGESGRGLNPNARNPNDAGPGLDSAGLGQWNRERLNGPNGLFAFAGLDPNSPSTAISSVPAPIQAAYIGRELDTTHANALAALQKGQTVADGANAWTNYYEGAKGGAAAHQDRIPLGQQFAASLKSQTPDAPAKGASNSEFTGQPTPGADGFMIPGQSGANVDQVSPDLKLQLANGSFKPGAPGAPDPQAMAAQMAPMSAAISGAMTPTSGSQSSPSPAGDDSDANAGPSAPQRAAVTAAPSDSDFTDKAPGAPIDFANVDQISPDMKLGLANGSIPAPQPPVDTANVDRLDPDLALAASQGLLNFPSSDSAARNAPMPPPANLPTSNGDGALAAALRAQRGVPVPDDQSPLNDPLAAALLARRGFGVVTPSAGANLGPASAAPSLGPGMPQSDGGGPTLPVGVPSGQGAPSPMLSALQASGGGGDPLSAGGDGTNAPMPSSAAPGAPQPGLSAPTAVTSRNAALAAALASPQGMPFPQQAPTDQTGGPIASDQGNGPVPAPGVPTPPVRPANLGQSPPNSPAPGAANAGPSVIPAPVPPAGSPSPQMMAASPASSGPALTGRTNNSVQTPTAFNLSQPANARSSMLAAALAGRPAPTGAGPASAPPAAASAPGSRLGMLAALLGGQSPSSSSGAPSSAATQPAPASPSVTANSGAPAPQPAPSGFNPYSNVPQSVIEGYNKLVESPYATPAMIEAAQARIQAYLPKTIPDASVVYDPVRGTFVQPPTPHKFGSSRNGVIFDESTGQVANGGANGAPLTKVMTPEEVKAAGLNPGSYQRNSITSEISPIASPAGNDSDTYAKPLVEGLGKYHQSLAEGVPQAMANVRSYNALTGALQRIQAAGGTTGMGAEEIKNLKSAINTGANLIGVAPPNDLSSQEEMESFSRTLSGGLAKAVAGSRTTNFDLKLYLDSNPGLAMSALGNQRLIGIGAQIEQRKADIGNAINQATADAIANGKRPSAADNEKLIRDYDANPANHIRDPISGQDLTKDYKLPPIGSNGAAPPQQQGIVLPQRQGSADAAPAAGSGQSSSDLIAQAQAAIARGAPRAAVLQRLHQMIDQPGAF